MCTYKIATILRMYIIEFVVTGKEYKPTFEDETENDGQQMVMILIDTFIQHMYAYIPMHTCVDTGNFYIACNIA